jgi:hypothetical protein
MAGGIGVGSALRRAREIRGIAVDEAARDTKLRPEQIRAIEGETFEDLGDQVYARAMLRTYAGYLGLDPGKVITAYARHAEDLAPPSPPAPQGPIEKAMAAARIRDNQVFLLVAAVIVLLAMIGVGFVSRRGGPAVAAIGSPSVSSTSSLGAAIEPTVEVALRATGDVTLEVTVDGEVHEPTTLREGEAATYSGLVAIALSADDGGAIELTVDGEDLGEPGRRGRPWEDTFEVQEAPPSPA